MGRAAILIPAFSRSTGRSGKRVFRQSLDRPLALREFPADVIAADVVCAAGDDAQTPGQALGAKANANATDRANIERSVMRESHAVARNVQNGNFPRRSVICLTQKQPPI